MSNIYQQIWTADQSCNGLKPILDDDETGDPAEGYVKVNRNLDSNSGDLRVISEVVIPEKKQKTYQLCRALFNNYALFESEEENETAPERQEIHDLVEAMMDTPPMEVARQHLEERAGTTYTREQWYNTIMRLWFEPFSGGGDPDLTGFEHVVVGEGEPGKVQGYHFWYRYYLDDGYARQVDGSSAAEWLTTEDRIVYRGSKQKTGQGQFPESVTFSFSWEAPNYEEEKVFTLKKSTGGFFVGCSVEGLLAIGTVRALSSVSEGEIEGAKYNIKMFLSGNGRHVRTFYPVFVKAVGPPQGVEGNKIRIVAALVNPKGNDVGNETVTMINLGAAGVALEAWTLRDKNFETHELHETLAAGDTMRTALTGSGTQLSNRGGTIELVDSSGNVIHSVSYPREEARVQGETILFRD